MNSEIISSTGSGIAGRNRSGQPHSVIRVDNANDNANCEHQQLAWHLAQGLAERTDLY
ncbi:hypothetical protein [Candidatus Mycobacterium methanotrophicum]|uniref:Uncharacterized protein n=1 Tax=Candidatus Mycobacterium methanotrophicum TaxID=2943498 RepID=A0ABY4QU73_9MYCO|nr:hypothetical protein [Candidatus Mycobacterium methanotrophicum]UQX13390.1 hypothetical protein M5I08_12295 [Candidatus Mycobacterium methanotrophicum]